MNELDSEWRRKGATLSHKTAQEEFGLTWEQIVRAIRVGKLHYREHSMYGNPWLRLLRREVKRWSRNVMAPITSVNGKQKRSLPALTVS